VFMRDVWTISCRLTPRSSTSGAGRGSSCACSGSVEEGASSALTSASTHFERQRGWEVCLVLRIRVSFKLTFLTYRSRPRSSTALSATGFFITLPSLFEG